MECTFRKRKKGKKILIFLACVMIFAVFSVIYLNQKLDPLVCAAATPQIKAEMTRVINEAISEAMTGYEEKLVGKLSSLTSAIDSRCDALETALYEIKASDDLYRLACGYRDRVFIAMQELRAAVDEAESVTDARAWPFPTYGDLLFGVR